MEHLTKQQLVLLTLLVSFVTALATGIFTVSLMDQAPQGVVRTIHEVVERIATPQGASVGGAVIATSTEDRIVAAVDVVSKSIVRLRSRDSQKIVGLGVIVSKEGVVMADRATLNQLIGFEAVYPGGWVSQLTMVQAQTKGDIVFLAPSDLTKRFTPVTFAKTVKLGQTMLSLSGIESLSVSQGIISRLMIDAINPDGSQPARIDTTIGMSEVISGSPLFSTGGEVIGINTNTVANLSDVASFYPVMQLRGALPKVK